MAGDVNGSRAFAWWPMLAAALVGGLVTHTVNTALWGQRVTAVEVRLETLQDSFGDFRDEQRAEMRAIRRALAGESEG